MRSKINGRHPANHRIRQNGARIHETISGRSDSSAENRYAPNLIKSPRWYAGHVGSAPPIASFRRLILVSFGRCNNRKFRAGHHPDESLLRPGAECGAVRRYAASGRSVPHAGLCRDQTGRQRFQVRQGAGRAQAQRNPAGPLFRLRPPLARYVQFNPLIRQRLNRFIGWQIEWVCDKYRRFRDCGMPS